MRDTVRGALWTISAGMGARGIGLFGTLLITHFIAPHEYGEVTVAAVLVLTANQLSTLGLGQYIVSQPNAGRDAAFHATSFHLISGVLALAILLAVGGKLAPALEAPGMARYLPGLVLAALFDRVAFVPERVLMRDLRFGTVSVIRTVGDLVHTATSVALAVAGWGAAAIVMGNVLRSLSRVVLSIANVSLRDWLSPCRYSLSKTREILAFGLPVAIGALSAFAARRWDNLLVSRFFGASTTGMYNLAYNLADVPAIQVGEQVGDVLLPSFARLPPERRPAALVRSLQLLSLIVFPLAVGLGAVAPTLVGAVFDERWQLVAPMLLLLSALSVTRPVGWTIASYLQARNSPRWLMSLELGKLVLLVVLMSSVGRRDPIWACVAVGLAYAVHMLASLLVVRHLDRLELRRSMTALLPALTACVPMVVAVVTMRRLLVELGGVPALLALTGEVVAGATGYAAAALLFAKRPSRDLVERLREAVGREPSSS